jgi:predicted ATPase
MALLARIAELVTQGDHFVVATHSPILLALPGARILQINEDGEIDQVDYDDAEPVTLTRAFLAGPEHFLRHLLIDD